MKIEKHVRFQLPSSKGQPIDRCKTPYHRPLLGGNNKTCRIKHKKPISHTMTLRVKKFPK